METCILMGGFGGQGVQTCGQLLAHGLNETNKHFTYYSQYGGAMRGGTSNCTVISSDEEIGSPSKQLLDYVAAFNIPSFNAFEKRVKPGGTIIVNSSIIPAELYQRDDIAHIECEANRIAEEIGSMKVLNIVMLGFICELTGIVPPEVMKGVVLERMAKKPEFLAMNERAFDTGAGAAKARA